MNVRKTITSLVTVLFIFMNFATAFAADDLGKNVVPNQDTQSIKNNTETTPDAAATVKTVETQGQVEEQPSKETVENQGQSDTLPPASTEEANQKGSSGNGSERDNGGQGGPGESTKGKIIVTVNVEGLENLNDKYLPIDVTLTKNAEETGGTAYTETKPTESSIVNNERVLSVTFSVEAGGKGTITGKAVTGYEVEPVTIEFTHAGKNKNILKTLNYTPKVIPVEKVSLNKSNLKLIEGYSEQLTSSIEPANASNTNINWTSDAENIVKVENGKVTAMTNIINSQNKTASATITAASEANSDAKAYCAITVVKIISLTAPDSITAKKGQVVILPREVTAKLSDSSEVKLPVTWVTVTKDGEEPLEDYTFTVPNPDPDAPGPADSPHDTLGQYVLKGVVNNTTLTTNFTINVDRGHAIPVIDIELQDSNGPIYGKSLTVGDSCQLTAVITPSNATVKDVVWSSTDSSVATVENGLVKAIAPGYSIITGTAVDGGKEASCIFAVGPVIEPALIFPAEENSSITTTEFEAPNDVCINIENLIKASTFKVDTPYSIKVEQRGQGKSTVLGEGSITITQDMIGKGIKTFSLYDALYKNSNNQEKGFDTPSAYSKMCFVYMSTDSSYPMGNEQTLMTNFKIGSAVPTIPKENIAVNSNFVGGNLDGKQAGIIFLLCRELDKPVSETTWLDYYKGSIPSDPYALDGNGIDMMKFGDEVKVKGKTDSTGKVIWEEPVEPIKLGGYILLEVTPKGYKDNLNYYEPTSEDSELVKEVSLERDGSIERNITNVYVGGNASGDSLPMSLKETGISLYVNDRYTLEVNNLPNGASIKWSSLNDNVAAVENGVVTAKAAGTAVITASVGETTLYCIVAVAAKPEPALIFPTNKENGTETVTEFATGQDVYINVETMITTNHMENNTVYHVKVEERGNGGNVLLGHEGTITITPNTKTFNLFDATEFTPASSYSNMYFVSMSTDSAYPRGDETEGATLTTNFKIGSATPTIPLENINVTTQLFGGPSNGNPEGLIVLLCRELEGPSLADVTWKNYYSENPPENPYSKEGGIDISKFTDEVKLIGIADTAGKVNWLQPRETIKLGGYVLLQVTPKWYEDNINLINPFADDGSLLKAVTLERDGGISRQILSVYSGKHHNQCDHQKPKADVAEGSYTASQTISFTELEPGAEIYYTLDGTTPVPPSGNGKGNGHNYQGPIVVDKNTTIKYITVFSDGDVSDVMTLNYVIEVPVSPRSNDAGVTVNGGTYTDPQTIEFTNIQEGTDVYYTLDGAEPSKTSGQKYTEPIIIDKNTTLKYVIVYSDGTLSTVIAENYVITSEETGGTTPSGDDGTAPTDNGGTSPTDNSDSTPTNNGGTAPTDNSSSISNGGNPSNISTNTLPVTGTSIPFTLLISLGILSVAGGLFGIYRSRVKE